MPIWKTQRYVRRRTQSGGEQSQVGNKAKISGHHAIENARALFESSVRANKPDFRYVALAIGAVPTDPPAWAIRACVEERERQESKSAALDMLGEIAVILDELVRVIEDHQRGQQEAEEDANLSLRAAINAACARLGLRVDKVGTGNDDWQRDIIRAWQWEQRHDAKPQTLKLEGWNITGRIERVLLAKMGPEFGYPADPAKAVWEALLKNEDDDLGQHA